MCDQVKEFYKNFGIVDNSEVAYFSGQKYLELTPTRLLKLAMLMLGCTNLDDFESSICGFFNKHNCETLRKEVRKIFGIEE